MDTAAGIKKKPILSTKKEPTLAIASILIMLKFRNKNKIIIPINDPGKKKLGINLDNDQDRISPNNEKPIMIAICLNIFII